MSTPIPEPLPNQQPTGTAQKPKPRTTIRRAAKPPKKAANDRMPLAAARDSAK